MKGRDILIAGVRPGHFEDAATLDDAPQGRAGERAVRLHPVRGAGRGAQALDELATELDSEQIRTQLVMTLDAESRVSEGEDANLWLDPTRMHLFDPASGENLTHGRGTEARAPGSA